MYSDIVYLLHSLGNEGGSRGDGGISTHSPPETHSIPGHLLPAVPSSAMQPTAAPYPPSQPLTSSSLVSRPTGALDQSTPCVELESFNCFVL